jgi:phosphogluconate dehydratase
VVVRLLQGNLVSSHKDLCVFRNHWEVFAPALKHKRRFFEPLRRVKLERDFVAVLRGQGPRANGMPELHKLTPPLSVLQKKAFAWRL